MTLDLWKMSKMTISGHLNSQKLISRKILAEEKEMLLLNNTKYIWKQKCNISKTDQKSKQMSISLQFSFFAISTCVDWLIHIDQSRTPTRFCKVKIEIFSWFPISNFLVPSMFAKYFVYKNKQHCVEINEIYSHAFFTNISWK